MTITGLTTKQVNMLDKIWSFEKMEDYLLWSHTLPESDRKESLSMIELLVLDQLDEDSYSYDYDTTAAQNILDKISKKAY